MNARTFWGESWGLRKLIGKLCPELGFHLLRDWETRAKGNERGRVYEWMYPLYYVEVVDDDFGNAPGNTRIILSIDIGSPAKDSVYWNGRQDVNPYGGSCFVRSRRWRNWLLYSRAAAELGARSAANAWTEGRPNRRVK